MAPTNGQIEVAFNANDVLDAVRATKGLGIGGEMTESSRPAVFRATEDDGYFCVIMPVTLA